VVQVLNTSYLHVNQRLKKEAVKLHTKFISDCFFRLEQAASTPTDVTHVPVGTYDTSY
jgi:hypothetical protein